MARKIKNFVRGMGTVLEVYPPRNRHVVVHRFYKRPKSRDAAILGYWSVVGTHLRSAMEAGEREYKDADGRRHGGSGSDCRTAASA